MNDKLLELRTITPKASIYKVKEDVSGNNDTLIPLFQEKVVKANGLLEKLKNNNQEVKTLKEQYTKAITASNEKQVSSELDSIIQKNNSFNQQLKDIMTQIGKDVEYCKKDKPNDPETKMKQNMAQALATKVSEVLTDSQNVQMEFKKGLKQKISRQTKYLDNTLTDGQIEEICNDPEKANQLLSQKLYGQASTQLQNAVSDIQDKTRDILKLEKSVQMVYQMFQDMAILVHAQGELLDSIELNINDTKKNVNQGETNLKSAKELHAAGRKKICCLIVIGLIILTAILIPIIISQSK